MKKRLVSGFLALVLCAGLLGAAASPAEAVKAGDVDDLGEFLFRVIDGLLTEYDCEKLGPGKTDEVNSYDLVNVKTFCVPPCLILEYYGVKPEYVNSEKRIALKDLEWLYKNILNWPDSAWDGMVSGAASNKGNVSASNYARIQNGYMYAMEGARGNAFAEVRIDETRDSGSRKQVVFNGRQVEGYEMEVVDGPSFYAEVERKNIDGKEYWTLYSIRKLQEGEDPFPPAPSRPTVGNFKDVFEDDYFAGAVKWALERLITQGISDTEFAPHNICTRAQAVTFLWKAAGSPDPKNSKNDFTDVPQDYYTKAVLWAVEQGIINGYEDNTFKPGGACSRGMIVTMLWRAAGKPVVSGNSFPDVAEGQFYTDAVKWAASKGITGGNEAGLFEPMKDCDRGMIVTFLHRYYTN